jgi:cysteine-rich repeat protein
MRSDSKAIVIGGLGLLAQACFVFDDKFYKNLEGHVLDSGSSEPDAGDGDGDLPGLDAAIVDAGEDAGPVVQIPLHLVDTCDAEDMFVLHDTHAPIEVSTVGFADDVSSTQCFPSVPGHEGWMAIDMVNGDRWHFHVRPTNKVGLGQAAQNPALYMRQECGDPRGCNAGTFLNLCGNGQDEHFTFEATSTTRWLFALDDINDAAGTYTLTVAKPVCGNSNNEHNEACDDGNTRSGDGCSADCRVELLSDNLAHSEFNDDWTTANVLGLVNVGTPQSVLGDVGGFCDQDLFAVLVEDDNTTITATVARADGSSCGSNAADISPVKALSLLGGDGRSEQKKESSEDPTVCPSLTAEVDAGIYYVRLLGDETKKTFNYKLTVSLSK